MAIYMGNVKLTGGEGVGINPNFVTNSNFQVWLPEWAHTGTISATDTPICNCWYSHQSDANGLRITRKNNTSGILVQKLAGEYAGIKQRIPLSSDLSGKTFCYQLQVDNQISYIIYKEGVILQSVINDPNTTMSMTVNDTTMFIYITFTNSSVHTIDWTKVEMGSVCTPYLPSLYADELIICSMYDSQGQVSLPSASHAVTSDTAAVATLSNNSTLFNGKADTQFIQANQNGTINGSLIVKGNVVSECVSDIPGGLDTKLTVEPDSTGGVTITHSINNSTEHTFILRNPSTVSPGVPDFAYVDHSNVTHTFITNTDIANALSSGIVSTDTQTFSGVKTFVQSTAFMGGVVLQGGTTMASTIYNGVSSTPVTLPAISSTLGSVSTAGSIILGNNSVGTLISGSEIVLGANNSYNTYIRGHCYFANGTSCYVSNTGAAKFNSVQSSTGTFSSTLLANGGTAWGTPQCRNIQVGTVDLIEGQSTLACGQIYCYVEED